MHVLNIHFGFSWNYSCMCDSNFNLSARPCLLWISKGAWLQMRFLYKFHFLLSFWSLFHLPLLSVSLILCHKIRWCLLLLFGRQHEEQPASGSVCGLWLRLVQICSIGNVEQCRVQTELHKLVLLWWWKLRHGMEERQMNYFQQSW